MKSRLWHLRWMAVIAAAAIGAVLGVRAFLRAPSLTLSAAATQALAQDGMTPVSKLHAYNFHLMNQRGQPVSLRDFHGKAVILTFIDPVCWWDCPLQAQEMALVNRLLGDATSKRVALVAIDINPVFHSVKDIRSFDQEQYLDRVPNWTFVTSPSLATLRTVWKRYYVQAQVPKNGMVVHPDLFYLIGTTGKLAWMSAPQADPRYFVGTAQLLATYVQRLLSESAPLLPLHGPAPVPKVLSTPPVGKPGPVFVHMETARQGWLVDNQGPYQVVYTTADGGRTWNDVGPPGLSKRGGLFWTFGNGGRARIVVRAYGYQRDPTLFTTTDWGQSWRSQVLSADMPAAAFAPLAVTGTAAFALTRDGLFGTLPDGSWALRGRSPGRIAEAGLAFSTSQLGFVSGMVPGHGATLLRTEDGGRTWRPVSLPVPGTLRASRLATLPPIWPTATRGLDGVVARQGERTFLIVEASADAGRTWQIASKTVQVVHPFDYGITNQGQTIYALKPVPGGTQVVAWAAGNGSWRSAAPRTTTDANSLDVLGRSIWVVKPASRNPLVVGTVAASGSWRPVTPPIQTPVQ